MVELIAFVRSRHPRRTLYLILDNARYQKCDLVRRAARRYRINLVYLPPYSPNLNLIERLWKFLKKEALSGVYHDTKQAFIDAIDNFIDEVNAGEYDDELASLLELKFQTLKSDI